MIKQFRQYLILRKLEKRTSCAKNTMGCYVNMVGVSCWYMGPGRLRNHYLKRKIVLLDKNHWLWKFDYILRKLEKKWSRLFWKRILIKTYQLRSNKCLLKN